jgi:hypothetical protein
MNKKPYKPDPIDTSSIDIPADLKRLVEELARHVHATWTKKRMEGGWKWGPERNDKQKMHPDLMPYDSQSSPAPAIKIAAFGAILRFRPFL